VPNEPKAVEVTQSSNELGDEELEKVAGGVGAFQKVKAGQKVGLEKAHAIQKAGNMTQKAGLDDLRAHAEQEREEMDR
jgi:hypothetical protein